MKIYKFDFNPHQTINVYNLARMITLSELESNIWDINAYNDIWKTYSNILSNDQLFLLVRYFTEAQIYINDQLHDIFENIGSQTMQFYQYFISVCQIMLSHVFMILRNRGIDCTIN